MPINPYLRYVDWLLLKSETRAIGQCLTHWGRGKMAAIFQTAFSNAFSWMKMFEFRLKFHWSLFLRVQLTIFQHWFRLWLGAECSDDKPLLSEPMMTQFTDAYMRHSAPMSEECDLKHYCPAYRTSLIATRFWVVMICPIIKCLTVLEFSFVLFDLCLFITIFNFILNHVPIVTFWIFTYHKIWILLIIFCFIWSYWIIYFLTCWEVFWSVVS